jgi:hypothetical protein
MAEGGRLLSLAQMEHQPDVEMPDPQAVELAGASYWRPSHLASQTTSSSAAFDLKLDSTIKKDQLMGAGFSHTCVWLICHNQTAQVFGLM